MILYHGSRQIIETPDLQHGKNNTDFGRGFYCTEQEEMAKEWACPVFSPGFANVYELRENSLTILDLRKEDSLLPWLALLMKNRKVQISNRLMQEAEDYLLRRFLPKTKGIDLIIGYRADDSYYSFVRDFVGNAISLHQLERIMQLGDLGTQIVLKTEKALSQLRFLEALPADAQLYHPRRIKRDQEARAAYRSIVSEKEWEGVFMLDLLRETKKEHSPLLQQRRTQSDDTRI